MGLQFFCERKKIANKVERFGINLHFKRQIIINSCKEKDTFQAEFHVV